MSVATREPITERLRHGFLTLALAGAIAAAAAFVAYYAVTAAMRVVIGD